MGSHIGCPLGDRVNVPVADTVLPGSITYSANLPHLPHLLCADRRSLSRGGSLIFWLDGNFLNCFWGHNFVSTEKPRIPQSFFAPIVLPITDGQRYRSGCLRCG